MEIQKEFQKLHKRFDELDQKFATKDDLKKFAIKDDLKKFATKDDLKKFATKDDLKKFAIKDDLTSMEQRLNTKFATKDDLTSMEQRLNTKFATKDDLKAQTQELKEFAELQTANLAAMVKTSIADPLQKHLENSRIHEGLKDRVDRLDDDMKAVKKAIFIK